MWNISGGKKSNHLLSIISEIVVKLEKFSSWKFLNVHSRVFSSCHGPESLNFALALTSSFSESNLDDGQMGFPKPHNCLSNATLSLHICKKNPRQTFNLPNCSKCHFLKNFQPIHEESGAIICSRKWKNNCPVITAATKRRLVKEFDWAVSLHQ